MHTLAIFRIEDIKNDALQHGRQRRAARPRRPLSGADLLDVRRRAPPDRRPAARRLRDARARSSRSSGRSST